MPLEFSNKVSLPKHVVRREMDGESVLLNLDTEYYHGLDTVGSKMLDVLEASDSVEVAMQSLLEIFDVEPDQLRADLDEFVTEMLKHGLLESASSPSS